MDVVEGCYLSTSQCIRTGQELARFRAENERLKRDADSAPRKAVGLSLLGGVALGYTLSKL